MPAFVLANLIITNPGIYMKYEAGFQNAFVDNQGKPFGQFLIVQDIRFDNYNSITVEGTNPFTRTVLIQFKDKDTAMKWYYSEKYQKLAKSTRHLATDMDKSSVVILDGKYFSSYSNKDRGFQITQLIVRDNKLWQDYRKGVHPLLDGLKGERIIVSQDVGRDDYNSTIVEGKYPFTNTVIHELNDRGAYLNWHFSPKYQTHAKSTRHLGTDMKNGRVVLYSGLDETFAKAQIKYAKDYQNSEIARRMADREAEFQQRLKNVGIEGARQRLKPYRATSEQVESLTPADWDRIRYHVSEMHEQGYTVVHDLITPKEVEQLKNDLQPFWDDMHNMFEQYKHNQTNHLINILAKTNCCDKVATSPVLRMIVAGVLGHDFILNAGLVAMNPDPGCDPQGLHRDDGFFPLLRPHMPLIVTAAIALDDFTPANGSTRFMANSHKQDGKSLNSDHENFYSTGKIGENVDVKEEDLICLDVPAGAVLMWDGAMLHGGGGNSTKDKSRRTLTLNYARGWLRTQFNQYLSIPRERILQMPSELQFDLGYHAAIGGAGTVDIQDPIIYLKKLMQAGGDGAQGMLGREKKMSKTSSRL